MKKAVSVAVMATAMVMTGGLEARPSDYALSFDMPGGIPFSNGTYTGFDMDLNFGTRYVSVNGVFKTAGGLGTPAVGTCFTTNVGGAYCNLQVDVMSINVTLQSNLNGSAVARGADGNIIATAPVNFIRP